MRLITLNGVKLLVYQNGMILRYSENRNGHLLKGWQEFKGCFNNKGYKTGRVNDTKYLFHRIIGFAYLNLDINNKKQFIDHIDRNRANNNLNNLRIVSRQENGWNREVKGYSWHKQHQKYNVRIGINGKTLNIGLFDTEENAHEAYLNAKAKYHVIQSSNNSNDNVNE